MTTIMIIILIALFDHTDRTQNVKIITGTSCEHLGFSLHELACFAAVSEKNIR